MRTQLNSYLLFCDYCAFNPFPVSKQSYLAYLAFLSKSLSCYRSLVNYVNILKHINKSLGADISFMHDYDSFLTLRALRRIMGDSVRVTHPVTVDILLNVFQHFDWSNQLHICMHALFLVAFFSFLRISNLVPYTLVDCHSDNAYFLRRQDVSFTESGAVLRVYRTKTIQFKHGTILYNEAEVFSLSVTNPNGRPMLQFDWLIHSGLILARSARSRCLKILQSDRV